MHIAAIIPAAGSGRRMGTDLPKAFIELGGSPLIVHTLTPFLSIPEIEEIMIPIPPGMEERFSAVKQTYELPQKVKSVQGGQERQDSVMNAVQTLDLEKIGLVLVHDAARPLVSRKTIEDVIAKTREFGAAVAAVPVTDTLKQIPHGQDTLKTVDRREYYRAQTPQGFQSGILMDALAAARTGNFYGTDTASLVEKAGFAIKLAEGDEMNIKITTEVDLKLAEICLKNVTKSRHRI
jgi:2-C-methyl-D-erythritol 4-phosphate cytidylyltransferase